MNLQPAYACCRTEPPSRLAGFTLVELLVVLAIVSLLLTLAVPRYFKSIDSARETVLVGNLAVARETIDKFFEDTGRYPDSLDELVEKKYLRTLPMDPITKSSSTWVVVAPDSAAKGNVFDLHSGAAGKGRNDVPYTER